MAKTAAPGKIPVSTNLTEEVRDGLDALRQEMLEAARSRGEDTSSFADRGALIGWMLERIHAVIERARELDAAEDRLQQVAAAERRLEGKLTEIRDATLRLDVETGTSLYVRDLFGRLRERGLDEQHILAVARVIRDAQLEPEKVAEALGAANIGGVVGLAEAMQRQVEEAKAAFGQQLDDLRAAQVALIEDNAAWRQANQQLKQEAAQLEQQIEEMGRKAQEAGRALRQAGLRAEEVGIYVDWLRSLGVERIEELPAETARLIAGVLLLSAVQSRGDELLQIPAKVGLRLVGGQMLLSELPYILAPREQYEAMQRAQLRQAARIEGRVQPPGGAGQGESAQS